MVCQARLAKRLIFILGILFLTGCAGKTGSVSRLSTPEWVVKGSGAFLDKEQKAFYGVGAIVGVRNAPLARTAADNRARAEISKVFETYSASLMRDYAASTTAADFKKVSGEQNIEQTIKTFSATTLSGVVIIDHWTDPSDHTYYALARLDLENFKNSVERTKSLNETLREFIKKNAEKAFEALEKEEAKQQ